MVLQMICMFFLGGVVSLILFHRKKPTIKLDTDHLANMLSYQFYQGIREGQINDNLLPIYEEEVERIAFSYSCHFKEAAEVLAKRIQR